MNTKINPEQLLKMSGGAAKIFLALDFIAADDRAGLQTATGYSDRQIRNLLNELRQLDLIKSSEDSDLAIVELADYRKLKNVGVVAGIARQTVRAYPHGLITAALDHLQHTIGVTSPAGFVLAYIRREASHLEDYSNSTAAYEGLWSS